MFSFIVKFLKKNKKYPAVQAEKEGMPILKSSKLNFYGDLDVELIVKDLEKHFDSLASENWKNSWYYYLIELSRKDYPEYQNLEFGDSNEYIGFLNFIEKKVFTKGNGISSERKLKAQSGSDHTDKVTIFYFALASFKYRYDRLTSATDKGKAENQYMEELTETLKKAGYSIENKFEDQIMLRVMQLDMNKYNHKKYTACCITLNEEIKKRNVGRPPHKKLCRIRYLEGT